MSNVETVEPEDRDAFLARLREVPAAVPVESDIVSDIAPVAPVEAEPTFEPAFAPTAATYDRVPAVTVPLSHPFKVDGVRVRSVSLRPPRLDYVEARAEGRISRLDMVAEMAGLSPDVIGALRWPDAERVLSFASDIAPDVAA